MFTAQELRLNNHITISPHHFTRDCWCQEVRDRVVKRPGRERKLSCEVMSRYQGNDLPEAARDKDEKNENKTCQYRKALRETKEADVETQRQLEQMLSL